MGCRRLHEGVKGILLSCVFAACSRGGAAASAERPLELLINGDVDTLDPRFSNDINGVRASRLLHASLIRLDPSTSEVLPYLGERWEWLDPLTLRVVIREGVRFHSGAPLTSKDVVATLAAYATSHVGARHARLVDPITDAVADGPYAVIIRLKRPHATLLADLELPLLRENEATSPPQPYGTLDGLGPFRVERMRPGEMLLAPADGGGMPKPRYSIAIRSVHDENARVLRLLAGRADVVPGSISPTLLPALEARRELTVVSRPGMNLTYLFTRTDQGPFADVRVRRALSLGVRREELTRTLMAGHSIAAKTMMPPGHWAHDGDAPLFEYNPAKARALLDEAGLRPDPDGVRVRATYLTSSDRLRVSVARTIAQDLREVGIFLEVVALESGILFSRFNKGEFDVGLLAIPELTEPNFLRVFMHSSFIPPLGANRARAHDAIVDGLLDQGLTTQDVAERKAIYARLEARIRDQLFIVPLWHEDQIAVTSPRVGSFMPSSEGRWRSLAQIH